MTMRELCDKQVVQVESGLCLGRVDDVEFDPETSRILRFVLLGRPRLFGLLGREEDRYIPWESVRRFGEDTILVEHAPQSRPPRRGRR